MQFRKIGIASDHAGRELKERLSQALAASPLTLVDYGVAASDTGSVDYPDYAAKLADAVARGLLDGGIAICGTGLGMVITANKFPGVRAVSAWDPYSARMGREHNDSNILCLGSRTLAPAVALELVEVWLATPFAGERHAARLDKIRAIEQKNCQTSR